MSESSWWRLAPCLLFVTCSLDFVKYSNHWQSKFIVVLWTGARRMFGLLLDVVHAGYFHVRQQICVICSDLRCVTFRYVIVSDDIKECDQHHRHATRSLPTSLIISSSISSTDSVLTGHPRRLHTYNEWDRHTHTHTYRRTDRRTNDGTTKERHDVQTLKLKDVVCTLVGWPVGGARVSSFTAHQTQVCFSCRVSWVDNEQPITIILRIITAWHHRDVTRLSSDNQWVLRAGLCVNREPASNSPRLLSCLNTSSDGTNFEITNLPERIIILIL